MNKLLQMAVAASHADKPLAEKYFQQAQQLDPACLQTYFALYKFYFYQGRLAEAEREALAALAESARQGGFPADYRQLAAEAGQWDMYASDVCLFYLYSLKAWVSSVCAGSSKTRPGWCWRCCGNWTRWTAPAAR